MCKSGFIDSVGVRQGERSQRGSLGPLEGATLDSFEFAQPFPALGLGHITSPSSVSGFRIFATGTVIVSQSWADKRLVLTYIKL